MDVSDKWVAVTGGASGLGFATAKRLSTKGAHVAVLDLPDADGDAVVAALDGEGTFLAADVSDDAAVAGAFGAISDRGRLAAVVHCAGRGGTFRVLDKEDRASDPELFETILKINVMGSLNVLRHGAAAMAQNPPDPEDRGVIVLTSSIAAYEGQIGQLPYATSKGGIISMGFVAARDLAKKKIRVCTIAPGVFDTPILSRLSDEQKAGLGASIPHPARLGHPDEFARLAEHIIDNTMLNGETIRLDGAMRMAAR